MYVASLASVQEERKQMMRVVQGDLVNQMWQKRKM